MGPVWVDMFQTWKAEGRLAPNLKLKILSPGMPGQPYYYAIPVKAKNIELAKKFIALATSPEVQAEGIVKRFNWYPGIDANVVQADARSEDLGPVVRRHHAGRTGEERQTVPAGAVLQGHASNSTKPRCRSRPVSDSWSTCASSCRWFALLPALLTVGLLFVCRCCSRSPTRSVTTRAAAGTSAISPRPWTLYGRHLALTLGSPCCPRRWSGIRGRHRRLSDARRESACGGGAALGLPLADVHPLRRRRRS